MKKLLTLGPEGTFSHQAAARFCPQYALEFRNSIPEVINALQKGEAALALLPFENTLIGSVKETASGLQKFTEVSRYHLEVRHFLIALESTSSTAIKVICSKAEAIAQCEKYLTENYPNAERRPADSTSAAAAALRAAKDPAVAIIGSDLLATAGLKIIAADIQDKTDPPNSTTFILVKALAP